VFTLYALVLGIALGYLAGGRIEGLATLGFRWAPVMLAGLAVQIAIFGPLAGTIGAAGAAVYVGSTAAVLVAVARNVGIPGLAIVLVGAISNLAAILANGGVMPADPGAVALAGAEMETGFTNSAIIADPALRPLTDIFAIPAGVPLANVFSVGDVLIAIGIVVAVVVGMRRARSGAPVQPGNSYD
jgi:hypothetical protein